MDGARGNAGRGRDGARGFRRDGARGPRDGRRDGAGECRRTRTGHRQPTARGPSGHRQTETEWTPPEPAKRPSGHRRGHRRKKRHINNGGLFASYKMRCAGAPVRGLFRFAFLTASGVVYATISALPHRRHGLRPRWRPLGPPPTTSAADLRRRLRKFFPENFRDPAARAAAIPDKSCNDLTHKTNESNQIPKPTSMTNQTNLARFRSLRRRR